jgi:hypothetical protein
VTFTIIGPPRTKKNSLRRIQRGARVYTVPSEAAVAWEASAIAQLCRQYRRDWVGRPPVVPTNAETQVEVRARIFRDADRGDLAGYIQAIGDALQGGHGKSKIPCVLADDRQIASWDGSRLLIDRENPRVELEVTPMV